MSTRPPFCGHCKNIGKQYNTHFTRKTPSQTSELVCPELLKKVCTDCKGRNHTFDKCPRPVPKVASTVAVPAYKAALQTPKSNVPASSVAVPASSVAVPASSVAVPASSVAVPASSVAVPASSVAVPASSVAVPASSVEESVAVPAYKYKDIYEYYSNYEDFSLTQTLNSACASSNASALANAQEPNVHKTLSEYCNQLYELIAEHYPYRAGKITGMFLELDMVEIIELIQNPASLQERMNEANEILDREYPWGYVDAIFKTICIHTRSSAITYNNIEVQPLDAREEYRKRVYVAHPTWPTSTINQIVEHFMKKQLSPEEIYEQFSNFERFKVEINLAKSCL